MNEEPLRFFTISPSHHVLEFSERLTGVGLGLELHSVQTCNRLVYFWLLEDGRFVGRVEPGIA